MFLCQKCYTRQSNRGWIGEVSSRRPGYGCQGCQSVVLCLDWLTKPTDLPKRKRGRPRKVGPAARADSACKLIGR